MTTFVGTEARLVAALRDLLVEKKVLDRTAFSSLVKTEKNDA